MVLNLPKCCQATSAVEDATFYELPICIAKLSTLISIRLNWRSRELGHRARAFVFLQVLALWSAPLAPIMTMPGLKGSCCRAH